MNSIGVATIGRKNVAAHIEAIGLVEDLCLVGVADAGQVRRGDAALYENAEAAITDSRVSIVALCSPPLETRHWIRVASLAGKSIVAEMPIGGDSRHFRNLVDHCSASGTLIVGVADMVYSECGSRIARCLDSDIGSPLFLECNMLVPRASLDIAWGGVLSAHGCGLFTLITKTFGRLDSVYARTRSLKTNRPSEDIAVAQLRFYDGIEGALIVNGLSDEEKMVIHLHGSRGSLKVEEDRIRFADGLQAQYHELANNAHATTPPKVTTGDLAEAQFLLAWIQHSARQNREISRKEAVDAIGG
jgi:predicted dehydrogenase